MKNNLKLYRNRWNWNKKLEKKYYKKKREEKIERKKREEELARRKEKTGRASCREEKVEKNETEGYVW